MCRRQGFIFIALAVESLGGGTGGGEGVKEAGECAGQADGSNGGGCYHKGESKFKYLAEGRTETWDGQTKGLRGLDMANKSKTLNIYIYIYIQVM